MAQTKRRRRSKHRGNAAGVVEARGRTGRKPTSAERSTGSAETRARTRQERLDKAPTWRSAALRGAFAAVFMFVIGVAFLNFKVAQAAAVLPLVLLFYIPMGYYLDLFLYRRRQARKKR